MDIDSENMKSLETGPFLATTALEEFWVLGRPILFLGQWCLDFDRREVWGSLRHQVLSYPWDDPARKTQARLFCRELFEAIFPHVSDYLNEVHGENRKPHYWRIIIGPWLEHYIQALYDRYVCLIEAFEKEPKLDTLILSPKSWVTPADWAGFAFLIGRDDYNLQLFSQLLLAMGEEFPAREIKIPQNKGPRAVSSLQKLKDLSRNTFSHMLEIAGSSRKILLSELAIRLRDVWKLSLATGFRAWPMIRRGTADLPLWMHTEDSFRSGLESLPLPLRKNDFGNLLIRTLPQNFPWLYLEGYKGMRKSVASLCKGRQKVLVSAFGWKSNERFKFIAADAAQKGCCLVGRQHGAGTGTSEYSPMEEFIYDEVDSFVTWGPLQREVQKAFPLADPKSQRLMCEGKERIKKRNGKGPLLFVGNSMPRYASSFRSQPISSQVLAYMGWQTRFLRVLPDGVRQDILMRPYPNDFGWRNKNRLSAVFSDLQFENTSQDILLSLNNCRLLVTDNPQTTFLEGLAMNLPLVLFFDQGLWRMRPRAKAEYERLKEVQIVHFDPEQAAAFVCEIASNPLVWWERKDVQNARQTFLEWLIIEDPNWVRTWREALLRWLHSEPQPVVRTYERENVTSRGNKSVPAGTNKTL